MFLGDDLEETQYVMEEASRKRKAPFEHQEAPQAKYIHWNSKLLAFLSRGTFNSFLASLGQNFRKFVIEGMACQLPSR